MSELRDLYQEVILDHGKRPRNHHAVADADCRAEGHNPLCGDRVTVSLKIEHGKVVGVGFEGSGCAISTASASMMTEVLQGKTILEVETMFKAFHELVAGDGEKTDAPEALGKLVVFAGVREFPVRVKCATLAWHTMLAALQQLDETVSTE